MKMLKVILLTLTLGLVSAPASAKTPGCEGKMWNPLTDLDYTLMGGIKMLGMKLMAEPKKLGEPPAHKVSAICYCKDGLQSGFGLGLTFWLPSYINDVSRQAGCLGFLGGTNVLPGFLSLSSAQEYNLHDQRRDGVTNMQIHWAYADITAIAGKQLFERCNAVHGGMSISYMTEPDFVFQNDVYSVIMTPQASIIAANPLLAQMACGVESITNTLGGWQDFGVCAWKGSRLPLSANAIAKDSAQVTNMDVTIKYLTRSALMGSTLRTMGDDATCRPQYSPFYDPFQHRFQWSYPNKTATRYNVDVLQWGMFLKDGSKTSMAALASDANSLSSINATSQQNSTDPTDTSGGLGAALNKAKQILQQLPRPLNYPTKEAGYMQVWEARQCCIVVLTIESMLKSLVTNLVTMGSAELQQMYEIYNYVNTAYEAIQDPVGAVLGYVGDVMADGLTDMAGGALDGLSDSLASMTTK